MIKIKNKNLSSYFEYILKFGLAIYSIFILAWLVSAGDVIVREGELNISTELIIGDSHNLSSTNIGIGTLSPAGMLHIQNSSAISVPWLNISAGGSGINDAIFAVVPENNSVGIGTSYPTGKLEISSGDSATAGQRPFIVLSNPEDTDFFSFGLDSQGDLAIDELSGAPSNVMTLELGGNVGIGTSTPTSPLHIATTTSNTLQIEAGVLSEGRILFGNSSDLNLGRIAYENSDNSMRFYTNVTEKMQITGTGNVGIGTTSPTHTLNVIGDLNVTGASYVNVSGIGASVYNSDEITISNSVETALTFNSETFDTDDMHSTVSNTGRITFNTPGVYLITGNIQFATNSAGTRALWFRVNGVTSDYKGIASQPATTITHALSISAIFKAVAGDYVELDVWQNSGGNLNVLNITSGEPDPTFQAQRLSG